MAINLLLQRELDRWYKLIDHPVQTALLQAVENGVRFPVVPAGRRSGKTERAKRFVAKQAMKNPHERYFIAAPTRDQVKKIYWTDMKRLCLASLCTRPPSETELIIFLDNGTEIHLIGLDRPERIEGVLWTGGVIDEIADIHPEAWEANIRPALDTFNPERPDYRAWCWLIGVPDGLNHYYDMAQYAESANDPDWQVFHWKSAEILPAKTIAAAKRQMSAKQFKQEYEASFETATGRIYEDYSRDNYTTATIQPNEQLLWYHDFNFTPLSSGIGVRRGQSGRDLYLLEEIVLTSAVSRQSALEFVDRFKGHQNRNVIIYGDPAGRAGEKHGHASDYTEMENILRENGWTYTRRVKPAAPAIKDRQNAVRAKVKNAAGEVSLYVNTTKAPYTHKGLATVQFKKGSTFLEEETDYQHITTAIGYMVDFEFPAVKTNATVAPLRA
ncbi:terminase large subunit domain-containing protein [Cupriavidus sp. a3]|uniref:terminase large subunit domain-containing protein n=1 Tax=Cupriavidus sp. a3 TaxID=3242158 RepID=UPI003D9C2E08